MNRRQQQLSGAVLLVMLIIVTIELSTQEDVKDGCGPNKDMSEEQYKPCWHEYWEGGEKHKTIPSQFIYII